MYCDKIKIYLLLLLLTVPNVNSCTNAKRPSSNGKYSTNMKFLKNDEKEMIDHQKTHAHAVSHQIPEIVKEKRIMNGFELNCNFEDMENCCWNNDYSSLSKNFAHWTVISSENWSKWTNEQHSVTSQNGPSIGGGGGHFLTVSANDDVIGGHQSRSAAAYVSCPIECSDHDVDITLKYQISSDVNLKVCLKPFASNSEQPLQNCMDLPYENRMTLKEITFPGGENFQIVIVASNVQSQSTIIIDDIEVSALPCMTSTSSTSTASTSMTIKSSTSVTIKSASMVNKKTTANYNVETNAIQSMCNTIECNFEQGDKCSYTNMHKGTRELFRKWDVVRGSFRNQSGGIKNAGQGSAYLATYLYPRDVAGIMTVTDSVVSSDFIIRFMIHKSQQNVELMGCCDSLSECPFSTEKSFPNKQWKRESFLCTKGTKKIIFYGYNIGNNEGALGLDNIELFSANGQWSPLNDHYKIC